MIRIDLEDHLILFSYPSGCGSIPILTEVPPSEIISMVAGPKKDETFLLLAILDSYRKAFDPVAATALPPYSASDLSFKLKIDLIIIDCPLYPLTEQEDAVLGTWLN